MARNLFIVMLCLFVLTGCVSRDAADDNLAKGCAAGVAALIDDEMELDVIGHEGTPAAQGSSYRHITLKAIEKGDWLEEEKEYVCIFEESFGFMKAKHTAAIYQIRIGDRLVGKSGDDIIGSAQEFMKLTDAIREAMYR